MWKHLNKTAILIMANNLNPPNSDFSGHFPRPTKEVPEPHFGNHLSGGETNRRQYIHACCKGPCSLLHIRPFIAYNCNHIRNPV